MDTEGKKCTFLFSFLSQGGLSEQLTPPEEELPSLISLRAVGAPVRLVLALARWWARVPVLK